MKRLHLFLLVITTALLVAPSGSAPYGRTYAQGQQDAAKKWDVAEPLGPTTAVAFDTSEGTWMNVDVSPDGRRIVFDLLGDIYTMPIDGTGSGAATRVTSGLAFDMQPRFSPDGKHIAFTSDRDGLWNIWTMDADGKNAVQISKERRWFVNSPTWAPDGNYIFARRHFVAQRSLGAGEIWMYHASGRRACRSPRRTASRRTRGSRRFRRMANTSITARTSRQGSSSNTTRIRTVRSTRSSGAI